jgi:hypothetical protein
VGNRDAIIVDNHVEGAINGIMIEISRGPPSPAMLS